MNLLFFIVLCVIPCAWYFWRQHKLNTPALQWPDMKGILGLSYAADPPRLSGVWNGRKVAFEVVQGGVSVTAWLNVETRLRVECGPIKLVTQRAGVLVPDAVEPVDEVFKDRLLARCSDKSAGSLVFDATMQQRLAGLPAVDFVGAQTRVVWTVPVVRDLDDTEALLGALCAVADGLESFPKSGAAPHAQANRP